MEALSQEERGQLDVLSQWERESSWHRTLRGWLVLLILLSGLVFVRTPNVVETVPGTMNMLRSQYHPVRFGLCFLSLAVVGMTVVVDDIARFCRARSRLPSGTRGGGNSSRPRSRPSDGTYSCAGMGGSAEPTPERTAARRMVGVLRFAVCRVSPYLIIGSWTAGVAYQLTQLVSHSREDVTLDHALLAANVFMAGTLLLFLGTSSVRWERYIACAVGVCAVGLAVWGCHSLAGRWHRDFVQHYDDRCFGVPVFSALAQLDPSRERICVCDERYYPFFGSHRQFNVSRPLWLPDFQRLRDYLLSRRATLLIARNHDSTQLRRYALVKQWIAEHPKLFSSFHQDRRFTIVRVDLDRLEAWPGVSEMEQEVTEGAEGQTP